MYKGAHVGVSSHQFPAIGEVNNMKVHTWSGVFVAVVAVAIVAAPHGNDNRHGHPAEVRSAPGASRKPWVPPQVPAVRVRRTSMRAMMGQAVSRVVMTTLLTVAYAGAAKAINASANALGFHSVFTSGSHITGFIWRMSPTVDKILGY